MSRNDREFFNFGSNLEIDKKFSALQLLNKNLKLV